MVSTRNTRADVVEAAGRLFAQRGYHGTSMRDLGREVGLLGSSLYSHVASKQDLLVDVVEEGARLFQTSAESAAGPQASPTSRLRALIEGHIDVVLDHQDTVRTFLNEAGMLDEVHRRRVLQARDGYESEFRQVLAAGSAAGDFRADLDPKMASIMILSILNAVDRWYRPDGRLNRAQLTNEVTGFILSALT
jgi:TetR/AcrR family transcriptional regulator, cholesterol catabolism regulator